MKTSTCKHHAPARWDDIFTEFFSGADNKIVTPRSNAYDTENALNIEMELPGVSKDDVSVTFENNVLAVKANRKKHINDVKQYYLSELPTGDYERKFQIAHGYKPDRIEAQLQDGILKLTIQKKEETKPIKVQII